MAAIGLTPISPVIKVVPVVEMPDLAKATKLPAEPKLTAAGPAARAVVDPERLRTSQKTPFQKIAALQTIWQMRDFGLENRAVAKWILLA